MKAGITGAPVAIARRLIAGFHAESARAPRAPSMRDFASREHDQRAAATQPEMRGAKARATARLGTRSVERVYEQAAVAQLGDPGEQLVGQHADVRPDTPQRRHQDQTVDDAVRMIGRDDHRTRAWNVVEVGSGNVSL